MLFFVLLLQVYDLCADALIRDSFFFIFFLARIQCMQYTVKDFLPFSVCLDAGAGAVAVALFLQ